MIKVLIKMFFSSHLTALEIHGGGVRYAKQIHVALARTTAKLRNYPPQNAFEIAVAIFKYCNNLEIVLTNYVLKHSHYF